MDNQKLHTKSKLLSVVLSLLLPGAGHFYVGQILKAFILLPLIFVIQYIFLYIFTFTVNSTLLVIAFILMLSLYIYAIYNPLKIIKKRQDVSTKYNNWPITLFIFMPLLYGFIFFVTNTIPLKTFNVPAKSMESTILRGDFIVAQKTKKVYRGELSIFKYPANPSIIYIKRCVAVGGDEIIYINKKLLIHFHEGDMYIKKNYPQEKIISLRDKLWVENPYIGKYPGIQYEPEGSGTIFEALLQYYSYNKEIDMIPIMVEGLKAPAYKLGSKVINALYTKVDDDHFYMVGDNRDNSNDSRFWGNVDSTLIFAEPKMIYFHLSDDWSIDWDRIGIKLNKNIAKNSI